MQFPDDLSHAPAIRLHAVDEARGIRRAYAIHRTTDLFGYSVVDWSWGRIGTRGQQRRAVFPDEADAVRFVGKLLRRRASAERRIGAADREIADGAIQSGSGPPSPAPPHPSAAPAAECPGPASAVHTTTALPCAPGPSAQPLHPFCPQYRAVIATLRYRLMRFALGLRAHGADRFAITPWGPCAPPVQAMLAAALSTRSGASAAASLSLTETLDLVARLEAQAASAVFPAQPTRRGKRLRRKL